MTRHLFPIADDIWKSFWGCRFSGKGDADLFVEGILKEIDRANCPEVMRFSRSLFAVWKPFAIDLSFVPFPLSASKPTDLFVELRAVERRSPIPPMRYFEPVDEEYFGVIEKKEDRAFRYFFNRFGNGEYHGEVSFYGFDTSILDRRTADRFSGEVSELFRVPHGDVYVMNRKGEIGRYRHESNRIDACEKSFGEFLRELKERLC